MYIKRKGSIWASELAEYLNITLTGPDFLVTEPSTFNKPAANSILYIREASDIAKILPTGISNIFILSPEQLEPNPAYSFAISENPRLDFVLCLNEFLVRSIEHEIHPSAQISPDAVLGRNIHIGPNVFIGPDVTLEDNVTIYANTTLTGQIHIACNAVVKENTVLGSEGYGFVLDKRGNPIHVPHLGSIYIGANSWVGANTTIERAEIEDTVIGTNSKIDDMVHIGGGCKIGDRVMITAGAVVGSNVTIHDDCWLAPNTTAKENITINANAMLGLGSVALSDLDGNSIYVGTPAKFLKQR